MEKKIITLRNQQVILDSDVAELYGVQTKRVNEAVSNNPEKFPKGYILELTDEEWFSLRSKNSTLKNEGRGQHTKYLPKEEGYSQFEETINYMVLCRWCSTIDSLLL